MKNKTLFAGLLLSFFAVSPSFAQTSAPADTTSDFTETVEYSTDKHRVVTNRFKYNWFISVGGGANILFGDHDKQCKFGERLAPALDVMVGKWLTPSVGLRFGYSGLSLRGATKWAYPSYPVDKPIAGGGAPHWLQAQKFYMSNLHVDVLFNLPNMFCGYKEDRIWNSSLYAGIGWAFPWEKIKSHEVSANIGWLNSFRLGKSGLALQVDVRGAYLNDRFDGEVGGRYGEGILTASMGLTYNFKPRGWERSKTIIRTDNRLVNDLNNRLAELQAENERLQQALDECNNKEAQVIRERIVVASANLVTFEINKSKLSKRARVSLGFLADAIKSEDSIVYRITGYADAGTGNEKLNLRLSQARAEAVYNCLVEEFGVPAERLIVDYKGGVENMFYDDPTLSRAAITVAAE